MSRKIVDDRTRFLPLKSLFRLFCINRGHEVEKKKVYRKQTGCILELYMKCERCGKKFELKPNFSKEVEDLEVNDI